MKCPYCGADLPEGATYCPVCARSLVEKTEVRAPKPRKKKTLLVICVLVIVLAAAVAVVLSLLPKTYEGGASLIYEDRDGSYNLLVAYPGDAKRRTPTEEFTVQLDPGAEMFVPAMLCVYREDSTENVSEEFLAKVRSASVTPMALSGEPMRPDPPAAMEDFPLGDLTSLIWMTSDCGECLLTWNLEMENGDRIILKQTYIQKTTPIVEYRYTDTPMDTPARLQALVDQIVADSPENAAIHLYLPPVTYTESLTFPDRIWYLYGEDDGTKGTTFTAPLTFSSQVEGTISILQNIDILGDGGTGITASTAVQLFGCTVRGWEKGVLALDGGSIYVESCLVEENGIGLHFNTNNYSLFNSDYINDTFRNNDVAVLIAALPGTDTLDFITCTFTGNGEAVQNEIEYPVDLSRSTVEP